MTENITLIMIYLLNIIFLSVYFNPLEATLLYFYTDLEIDFINGVEVMEFRNFLLTMRLKFLIGAESIYNL